MLSEAQCRRIFERAHAFARGGGDTAVRIWSWWQGELRWGRNRPTLSSDRRNIVIEVSRTLVRGVKGTVTTNQFDDISLESAVRAAERKSRSEARPGRGLGFYPPFPQYRPFEEAQIWSEATYGLTTEARRDVAHSLIGPAEKEGFYSAGYLEVRAGAFAEFSTSFRELRTGEHAFWEQPYVRWTQAQCSTTVRDKTGTGSGWAGASSYDWTRIDPTVLAERAVTKCRLSRDPLALEPGRYTVILEPQAVADLLEPLVGSFGRRERPEAGFDNNPWLLGWDETLLLWRSKLGLKVADERITIGHDPRNPDLGIVIHPLESAAPVTWIKDGVLTSLGHRLDTALESLDDWHRLRGGTGYRMAGGETSTEEMIRTTRRGLLVTRFWNVRVLDARSLLSTGLTRDGLWLIENGEITRAVKNFRFTESPLLVLNNVEQLGQPMRVFRPTRDETARLTPAVVPPLKAREFSFTSLVDAV
jgi:predicted Zn-dependent protease